MVDRPAFDDYVGGAQALVRIALVDEDVAAAEGIGGEDVVRRYVRMDEGGAARHGLERIEHERKDFPVDADEAQGFLGDQLALGRDRDADFVARPAGVVPEHAAIAEGAPHHLPVAHGVDAVGPAGVRLFEGGDLGVRVCEYGHDSRQRLGRRGVQRADPRVGVRATKDFGVEEVGEAPRGRQVVGVEGPAARLVRAVDLGPVLADEGAFLARREGRPHRAPAFAAAERAALLAEARRTACAIAE